MLSFRADKAPAPRHHTSELPPATYPSKKTGSWSRAVVSDLRDQTASSESESKDSWMIYVSLCLLGLFELREDGYEGELKDNH